MLLNLLRYLRGYVSFTASGKFPERFLNAAAVNKLNLWNAYPSGNAIRGSMSASDYKRARKVARRAGVKLKITKKQGLPFIAHRHRDRIGLPIGALAGAVLLIVLSQFIWTVDIVGAENISDCRIMEALKENGVYPGGFKGFVDVRGAQRDVQFKIDELSWVSINNLGCKSTVDVREKAKKSEPPGEPLPCNIKAKCDGVITKINAQNGVSSVTVGSGVSKGDLLVSGVLPTKQDTIRFVRAEAEVFADVNSKLELNIPKKYNYYSLTENKVNRKQFNILWLNFPVNISFVSFPQSVSTVNTQKLVLGGNAMPLGTTTRTSRELLESSVNLTQSQAETAFKKTMLLREAFENPESSVKSRKISVSGQNGTYLCSCEYVLSQNIAESVEFNVTEE